MQICSDCGHKMFEETKYMSWLSLMNFFEFLQSEGYVELETAEFMRNRLMDFKPYAEEVAEKKEMLDAINLLYKDMKYLATTDVRKENLKLFENRYSKFIIPEDE